MIILNIMHCFESIDVGRIVDEIGDCLRYPIALRKLRFFEFRSNESWASNLLKVYNATEFLSDEI